MPESNQQTKPETATKPVSDIDVYRQSRKQQLLAQVHSISELNPDVSRRKLTHIINTAVAAAFG